MDIIIEFMSNRLVLNAYCNDQRVITMKVLFLTNSICSDELVCITGKVLSNT